MRAINFVVLGIVLGLVLSVVIVSFQTKDCNFLCTIFNITGKVIGNGANGYCWTDVSCSYGSKSDCPEEGLFSKEPCSQCLTMDSTQCSGDDVYWANACGALGGIKEKCFNGCEDGACIPTPNREGCKEGSCLTLPPVISEQPDTIDNFNQANSVPIIQPNIPNEQIIPSEPEVTAECTESNNTYYTCPGGSKVLWCQCIGQKLNCLTNPVYECPSKGSQI